MYDSIATESLAVMASRPALNLSGAGWSLSTRLSAFWTSSSFICCCGGGPGPGAR